MTNVVYLHGAPQPLGQFLRIGTSGYRWLEDTLHAGRLPFTRFVADAGSYLKQADLITALKAAGSEIILDTNVAELSVLGRFQGSAKSAPWANPNGVLTETDLKLSESGLNVISRIADFVLANGITRVMAPTHVLHDATDPLLSLDVRFVRCCGKF